MTQPASAPNASIPASIQLFSRSCTVTVGTVQITNQSLAQQTGLDVWFTAKRSLRPKEPNTLDLRIQGLTGATRAAITALSTASTAPAPGAKSTAIPVQIDAGYEGPGGTSTIFLGQCRSAQATVDGVDIPVELTTGDADQAAILARSTASFKAGTNAYVVAMQIISDMGLSGPGNIQTVASILRSAPAYSRGVVLKGNSLDHLVDLARSCGLEVTLQSGIAQWTSLGQPIGGQAYVLSSSTGLLDSPSLDSKGVLSCKTLMLPGLSPGQPISMNAKFVSGLFRIIAIETVGDTAGKEWSHKIEAKPYGMAA